MSKLSINVHAKGFNKCHIMHKPMSMLYIDRDHTKENYPATNFQLAKSGNDEPNANSI